jgi:hypothetical protein
MYSSKHHWDVSGTTEVEIMWSPDGGWLDIDNNPLPDTVRNELDQRKIPRTEDYAVSLIITWRSVGYYDPGVRSGPIEQSYAPEGEDERTLNEPVTISILGPNNQKTEIDLSDKASHDMFDSRLDEINDEDLPEEDDTDNDYEYERRRDEYNESRFSKALNKALFS